MSRTPIVYPAKTWTNQNLVLYHGTIDKFVPAILSKIQISLGKPFTDFGPGFYTTTVIRQAHTWAAQMAASKAGSAAAVIQITVSREHLAVLQTLAFVRGDFKAQDYWSFVHYCRAGATNHNRSVPSGHSFYDVVYGPVAAFWNQRMIIADADQISFHTTAAESMLNNSSRKRII
jgi:hypothetical protein